MPSTLVTPEAYTDLEIRILELQDEGYPVEITFSGEQEFPRGYLKPDILSWVPGVFPPENGERLFELLFADDELKEAWGRVQGQSPRLRIRLRIDPSVLELHAIPWELLRDASPGVTSKTLAADVATPFSRYLAGQWRHGSPVINRPIKLLVAIANPSNLASYELDELEVETEKQLIEEAISGLDTDQLELTFLDQPVTLEALEAELSRGYHVLHLVAHGRFQKGRDLPSLFLTDAKNEVKPINCEDFAEMLSRQGAPLRLVFLASCQTVTCSPADVFRGFAQRMIAAGVPAVLAMQDKVPIETARKFASVFYKRLLQHGLVDLASNEARSAVLSTELPGASIPVLFMRLREGMLFVQRGRIFGKPAKSFWSILLGNISEGECVPFLGPGMTRGLLPTPGELAQTLAHDYNYPFGDSGNLPSVAQFVGTFDNLRVRKDVVHALTTGFKKRTGLESSPSDRTLGLSETIEAANWSELGHQVTESEAHHCLADLDLPLYVTTNFDNLMTLALEAKGRNPRRETIGWRGHLRGEATSSYYDLNPPVDKGEPPVVLHLFGTEDDPLSMVLTEDDHLDYMACISRDYEYLLPTSVQEALASTTLLFLGYRLEDLDLRVIMRGLLTQLDLERWGMLHVAVQIEAAEVDKAKNEEVVRYFQRYFANSRIDVYWGSVRQFLVDLHTRWREYRDG